MTDATSVRYRSVVCDSTRWDGFPFRPDDIVISTPAKCGTTWTQMICALLIMQQPRLSQPLSTLSPWLDMLTRNRDAVVADLEAQPHRRFIKTHTPLDGLPRSIGVTYICVARDPRDVALSWDNHMANADMAATLAARNAAVGNDDIEALLRQGPPPRPETEVERFRAWVDHPGSRDGSSSSLYDLLHHLATFWAARNERDVILLHYDDLKADLDGQMRALANRLAIAVPEDRWPALVEAARFERMRANADQVAPGVTESIWQDNAAFFHRGTSGQWRALLDDADVRHYDQRVRELADPALAAWVHHGRAAFAGAGR
jgi:hypothetical protein